MDGFTVELKDRVYAGEVRTERLTLRPVVFSARRWGGSDRAEIRVEGDSHALWDVLNWLRHYVIIRNPAGVAVWAGIVEEALIGAGAVEVGLSLEPMANKVAVAYSTMNEEGAEERATTSWAQDAASVAQYGTKEALLTLGGRTTQEQAEAARATALANNGTPVPSVAMGGDEPGATLLCRGLWSTMDWTHYAQPEGQEQHDVAADIEHMIGWGLGPATTFGLWHDRIDDIDGRLGDLIPGNQVNVSGSAKNDGNYTVTSPGEGYAPVTYTATTIDFEPQDDIGDTAGGLAFLREEAMIKISGSVQSENNGLFWVTFGSNAHAAEVTPAEIVDADAGPSITIKQGHGATFDYNFDQERNQASITLTGVGVKVAQQFQLASATGWTVREAEVQVRKVGSPSDDLRFRIYSDSSGSPNAVLLEVTVDAADVPTSLAWLTIDLGAGLALSAATDYWVCVDRTGAVDYDDFFVVGLESAKTYARGDLKVQIAGAGTWTTRTPDAHMPFRLWALTATTTQIDAMLDAAQFYSLVRVNVASGVEERPYRAGDLTVLEEVERLMAVGTSAGGGLVATVDANRAVRVEADPTSGTLDWVLGVDGVLRHPITQREEPGVLPAGQWVRVEGIPSGLGSVARFFVDEAEYEVEGGRMRLTPRGRDL